MEYIQSFYLAVTKCICVTATVAVTLGLQAAYQNLIPPCTSYTVCLTQHSPNYHVCNLLSTVFLILLEKNYHESTFQDCQSTVSFTHQSLVYKHHISL